MNNNFKTIMKGVTMMALLIGAYSVGVAVTNKFLRKKSEAEIKNAISRIKSSTAPEEPKSKPSTEAKPAVVEQTSGCCGASSANGMTEAEDIFQ